MARAGARGAIARWRQHHGDVEAIVDGFAREAVHAKRLEPADQERGIGLAGALELPEPLLEREVVLVEGGALAVMDQQREQALELVAMVELLPVDRELPWPAAREPVRHRGEEPEADLGPGDPGARESRPVTGEVAASIEPRQHPLHLRQDPAVVGIGAEKAQRFVEADDLARGLETARRESVEQRELCRRRPTTVIGPISVPAIPVLASRAR